MLPLCTESSATCFFLNGHRNIKSTQVRKHRNILGYFEFQMLSQNASSQVQQRGQSVAAEMLLVVTNYAKRNKCSGSAFEADHCDQRILLFFTGRQGTSRN